MKFFFHYSAKNFSNTYLIGPKQGGDAILIDPCILDVPLLDTIEGNHFNVKWVLITRCQIQHIRGLQTLKKIYNAEIFSRQNNVIGFPCHRVKSGMRLVLGVHVVDVMSFPEYSHDAVTYRINNWVFCGDILTAGLPGRTTNQFSRSNIQEALLKKLFIWHNDILLFPGEGPPTILRSERLFNIIVREVEGADCTDLELP